MFHHFFLPLIIFQLVVIMGSLTTCDPGDIAKTLANCKQLNVRCSVISLAAEVRILKELTKVTGGEYGVILDDLHFRDLLYSHLEPPPTAATAEASLIKMGFPCHSGLTEKPFFLGNLVNKAQFLCQANPTRTPVRAWACASVTWTRRVAES